MTLRCTQCGFESPPGMRFCGNCGARLEEKNADHLLRQPGALTGANLPERLREAGLQAAGQRRNVTILFTDLSGYTALSAETDNEIVYEIIQRYLQLLADAVYKYDGIVDKFTGDGLMALFGAPLAQENNAELAVLAALEMQINLQQLNETLYAQYGVALKVRVGLNSGSVVVGGVGSNLMMDYTAIGDTVNLASRLEQAAEPGSILVSESVYRQTHMLFDMLTQDNLLIKGYAQPIRAYRVLGHKTQQGPVRGLKGIYAPMIGRDRELYTLLENFQRMTHTGKGCLCMVRGEAGLGKSRLLREFRYRVRDITGLRVVEGHSLTYRRSVSYWIFIDLFRRLLGVNSNASETDVRLKLTQHIQNLLEERAHETLPYLENMLSLRPDDQETTERLNLLEADQLRQRIFLAVRDILIAQARIHPLVLILEDLHWADDASLNLLIFLLDSIRDFPLMVVGITRPVQEGLLLEVWQRAQQRLSKQFMTIDLQTLSETQSVELLTTLLNQANIPERLRQQIIQRAAGIPFYLEEILRMLMDRGALTKHDGNLLLDGVDNLEALGVPDSLQGLILTRYDRLPPAQKGILRVACAIGRQFNVHLLEKILGDLHPALLREHLSYLVQREFLWPKGPESGDYIFKHVLVSDAIYSTLLRRERSELHGKIGLAIETLYKDRLDDQIELLARHFSWSTYLDKALHYLTIAAQKAARNYNNQLARQNYEQALELLPKVPHENRTEIALRRGLGDTLVFIGEYPGARVQFEAALMLVAQSASLRKIEEQSVILRKISVTYERQGNYEAALDKLQQAQTLIDAAGARLPVERALILNDTGWIHFRRGELDDAETKINAALKMVQEITAQANVIASIYNRLGGVYYQKDDLEKASQYVQRSLVLRNMLGDLAAVARSYNNLGLLDWKRGKWDSALKNFQRSLDLNANLGDAEAEIELLNNIGLLQMDKGNLAQAEKMLQSSLEKAQRIGHSMLEAHAYLNISRLWLVAQNWQACIETCQKCLEIFDNLKVTENLIDLLAFITESQIHLGKYKEAKQTLDKITNLTQEMRLQPMEQGRIHRVYGLYLAYSSPSSESSEKLFQKSIEFFEEAGSPIEVGRVLATMSKLMQKSAPTLSKTYQFRARQIFQSIGALLDLQRL